jgi:hypothetical protein
MERIVISSSLKHKELIREAITQLDAVGVEGIFPNLDSGVAKEDVTLEFMQRLEADHFQAVDSSQAMYVICPEGYVGTLVSVEIGYAKKAGKKIIFSETPEDLGLQALADGIISLQQLASFKEME